MFSIRTAFLFGLLLVPLMARAATFQVSPTGSDSTPCGTGARATINGGLACLQRGDTLEIAGGTYAECLHNQPGWGSTPIPVGTTLRARAGDAVWLKPSSPCPAAREFGGVITLEGEQAMHLVIDGLNVDGSGGTPVGLSVSAKSVTFQNMTVQEIAKECVTSFSNAGEAFNNTYRHMIVQRCGLVPTADVGSHGFYINSFGNTIEDSIVRHNNCIGITYSHEGGSSTGNVVRNSQVYGNGCAGIVAFPGNTLEHNIVCNNYAGIDAYASTLQGNRVFGNREVNLQLKGSGHTLTGNSEAGQPGDCPGGPAVAGAFQPTPFTDAPVGAGGTVPLVPPPPPRSGPSQPLPFPRTTASSLPRLTTPGVCHVR